MHCKIFKLIFPLDSVLKLDILNETETKKLVEWIKKIAIDISNYNNKDIKKIEISRKDCLKTIYKIKHKNYNNFTVKDFDLINLTLYKNQYCKLLSYFVKPKFSNYYFKKF